MNECEWDDINDWCYSMIDVALNINKTKVDTGGGGGTANNIIYDTALQVFDETDNSNISNMLFGMAGEHRFWSSGAGFTSTHSVHVRAEDEFMVDVTQLDVFNGADILRAIVSLSDPSNVPSHCTFDGECLQEVDDELYKK